MATTRPNKKGSTDSLTPMMRQYYELTERDDLVEDPADFEAFITQAAGVPTEVA